jgi:hypothetical protein
MERILLDKIILDPQLQPRETMRMDIIDEYAESVDDLPPGKAVRNGDFLWLTEGWHRHYAHKKAGRKDMALEVTEGEWFDALCEASGSNHGHGLRRTNDDKRRAVANILKNEDGVKKSDRWIAELCHVSNHLVAEIRSNLSVGSSPNTKTECLSTPRKGRDGKTYKSHKSRSTNKPASALPGQSIPARLIQRNLAGNQPPKNDAPASQLKQKVQTIVHAVAGVHDELQQACEGSDGVCRTSLERQRKKLEFVIADIDLALDRPKQQIILPMPLDTGTFRAAWDEWTAFRRQKKAPLTPISIKKQIEMLTGLGSDGAIEAINNSIRNGWTGLFAPKKGNSNGRLSRIDAPAGKYDNVGIVVGTKTTPAK